MAFFSELIQQGPGEQLEFMEVADNFEIAKTLCAFLNGKGGQLIVGLKNKHEINGVNEPETAIQALRAFLQGYLSPHATLITTVISYANKQLLFLAVWPGAGKPYVLSRGIYIRNGNATVRATTKEMGLLMDERRVEERRWEKQAVIGGKWDDIDEEEIKKTFDRVTGHGLTNAADYPAFLGQYGLSVNGNPTNNAMILFGKAPARYVPGSKVIVSFTSDAKHLNVQNGEAIFDGTLIANYLGLIELINKISEIDVNQTNVKIKNVNAYDFPLSAIKEAIINALMHNDYSESDPIKVHFFSDRLEISNSGILRNGLNVDSLRQIHYSNLLNPDIVNILYLNGIAGHPGYGSLVVLDEFRQIGLQDPFWTNENGSITLTLPGIILKFKTGLSPKNDGVNNNVNSPDMHGVGIPEKGSIEKQNDHVNDSLKSIVDNDIIDVVNEAVILLKPGKNKADKIKNVSPKVIANKRKRDSNTLFTFNETDGISNGVKLQLKKVVLVLKKHPGIMATDIASYIGKPKPTTERYIGVLKRIAMIEFRGAPKSGGYFLTEKALERI